MNSKRQGVNRKRFRPEQKKITYSQKPPSPCPQWFQNASGEEQQSVYERIRTTKIEGGSLVEILAEEWGLEPVDVEVLLNYVYENPLSPRKSEQKKASGCESDSDEPQFTVPSTTTSKKKNHAPSPSPPPQPSKAQADYDQQDDDDCYMMTAPKMTRALSQFPQGEIGPDYDIDKYIGKGAYGIVALGQATRNSKIETGTTVAVKKQTDIFSNVFTTKRLLRELRVLRALNNHNCIVKLIDVKIPEGSDLNTFSSIFLVFEYVQWDLSKLLKMDTFLSDRQVKAVTKRILYGIKYMHAANIVHRDLKPANILLNSQVDVKLCDFGLARCLTEHHEIINPESTQILDPDKDDLSLLQPLPFDKHATNHVVTRYYRAPEISLQQMKREHLLAIDMWSVGCILGELLQMIKLNVPHYYDRQILMPGVSDGAFSPVAHNNGTWGGFGWGRGQRDSDDQLMVIFRLLGTPNRSFIDKVEDRQTRKWLTNLKPIPRKNLKTKFPYGPSGAVDLMVRMLAYDPEDRITVDEALNHPWLADFEDSSCRVENSPETFEFEDVELTRLQLRALILDEILIHNPDLKEKFKSVNLTRMEEDDHESDGYLGEN